MADKKRLIGIVWRQIAPNEIEFAYADGALEHTAGTHAEAAHLAKSANMDEVPTAVGTIRWVEQLPKAPKRN